MTTHHHYKTQIFILPCCQITKFSFHITKTGPALLVLKEKWDKFTKGKPLREITEPTSSSETLVLKMLILRWEKISQILVMFPILPR